jgi:hypothetical protein
VKSVRFDARRRDVSNLEDARNDVEQAGAKLESVLAGLRALPRAEKVAVSRAIEEALDRLRAARAKLTAAEAASVSAG